MISFKNISKFLSYISGQSSVEMFDGFCIDSREYKAGEVFIAISGVNYNAFEFIDKVIEKKCTDIVYTANEKNLILKQAYIKKYPGISFIEVSDSVGFLQDLARDHRERLRLAGNKLKVVSISGSNGKTTCKEMLKHLCGDSHVVATQKNDNNHLGVPLTLLRMNERTQYGIIELGSNHPGEIPLICNLTQPDYAYVTNIGYTHMEFFPTLEDVFKEESFPLNRATRSFINHDDKFLANMKIENSLAIGEMMNSFKCSHDSLNILDREVKNKNLIGKHNYHNLGAMIHVAIELLGNDHIDTILKRAESFQPGLMRSEWREKNKKNIFLDAYNANPSSMVLAAQAFLHYLSSNHIQYSDAILVIGDMMELGSEAQNLHEQTAMEISKLADINVVFIGQFASSYQKAWGKGADVYENVDEFMKNSNKHFDNISHIFLKASRSLQFERILDRI